jgi:hypothetical protein
MALNTTQWNTLPGYSAASLSMAPPQPISMQRPVGHSGQFQGDHALAGMATESIGIGEETWFQTFHGALP